jgi:hypothetical protein
LPAAVGSVLFGYDADRSDRVESAPPYAIAGVASGAAGTKLTIRFTVTTKRRGKN